MAEAALPCGFFGILPKEIQEEILLSLPASDLARSGRGGAVDPRSLRSHVLGDSLSVYCKNGLSLAVFRCLALCSGLPLCI